MKPEEIINLRNKAESGDAEAQYKLATGYFKGDENLPKNLEMSVKFCNLAIDQGHPGAHFLMGYMYSTGFGMPQDGNKKLEYYQLAANKGFAQAQVTCGSLALDQTPPNFFEARKWFQLAVDQNFIPAKYYLGRLLDEHFNSPDEAKKLIIQAAEAGMVKAQEHLPYFDSPQFQERLSNKLQDNAKRDELRARREAKSAIPGDQRAKIVRVVEDQELIALKNKAAMGDSEAQYLLSTRYQLQEITPHEAKSWCQKAAEQGHIQAQHEMNFFYNAAAFEKFLLQQSKLQENIDQLEAVRIDLTKVIQPKEVKSPKLTESLLPTKDDPKISKEKLNTISPLDTRLKNASSSDSSIPKTSEQTDLTSTVKSSSSAIGVEGADPLGNERPDSSLSMEDKKNQLKMVNEQLITFHNKAKKFSEKAAKERNLQKANNYLDAEKAIELISTKLNQLISNYINSPAKVMVDFKKDLRALLKEPEVTMALTTIETHRGLKQIIIDILTAILTLGGSLIYGLIFNDYSVFKAPTDTKNKYVELEQSFETMLSSNN